MTAKGKINASHVERGHRIIVKVSADGTVRPSDTKTGEGVQVARVVAKNFRAAGQYEARGKYIVETSAGSFEAAPIQTMWLAPEDNAGIKRARAEAEVEAYARRVAAVTDQQDERQQPTETPAAPVEVERGYATSTTAAEEMDEPSATAQRAAEAPATGAAGIARLGRIFAQVLTPAPPVGELEEFTRDERDQLADDFRASGALDDAHEEADRESWETHLAKFSGAVLPRKGSPELKPMDEPSATAQQAAEVPTEEAHTTDVRQLAGLSLHRSAQPEDLTPNSQDCKVDNMNNASETVKHTGSTVVALIERVWDRIRADHPELPEIVVTTGSGEGVKWGHFRPDSWKLAEGGAKRHEFFLASEALAKGASQVLQTTIHEAAHTLSRVRGVQDTSRQGRWHNAAFRKAAEELGLEHKSTTADKTVGFAFVTLTGATKTRYADLLAELERELKLTGLLPSWLGGTDEEDERGGEKITGKPKSGEDKPKSGGFIKATCECDTIIRVSRKTLDLGLIRCDECKELFTADE